MVVIHPKFRTPLAYTFSWFRLHIANVRQSRDDLRDSSGRVNTMEWTTLSKWFHSSRPSTSKHVRCGGSFATMPGRCPCLVRLPHQARTPIQPEHQDCPRSGNKRRRNTRASRCQTSKSWQLVAEVAAKSTGECEHCRRPDLWLPRLPLTIERHAAKRQSATSSATAATPP